MSQGVNHSTFSGVDHSVLGEASINPLERLSSIFERGILSAQELQELNLSFDQGYDKNPSRSVFLNVITNVEGVDKAINSPSDGAFAIGLERKNDGALIEDFCNQPEFRELLNKELQMLNPVPDFVKKLFEDQVRNKYLSTHPNFLEIIAERMNRIAVLVLNIDPLEKDYLSDPSGCHDAVRETVAPEQISSILLSKNFEKFAKLDTFPKDKKLYLLSSIQLEITYCYEKKMGQMGQEIKKIDLEIEVPKFQDYLNDIYETEFLPKNKPMYIHVTRV